MLNARKPSLRRGGNETFSGRSKGEAHTQVIKQYHQKEKKRSRVDVDLRKGNPRGNFFALKGGFTVTREGNSSAQNGRIKGKEKVELGEISEEGKTKVHVRYVTKLLTIYQDNLGGFFSNSDANRVKYVKFPGFWEDAQTRKREERAGKREIAFVWGGGAGDGEFREGRSLKRKKKLETEKAMNASYMVTQTKGLREEKGGKKPRGKYRGREGGGRNSRNWR